MFPFAVLLCCTLIVSASLRNSKSEDVSSWRQSHNEMPFDKQPGLEAEQLYYLPLQTEFSVSEVLKAGGGLTTSPPQLSVKPASVQTGFQESTSEFYEDSTLEHNHYKVFPSESLCISETPVFDLQSNIITESSAIGRESVILAGHLGVASKTSSFEDVSDIHNYVLPPSLALQGTMIHSHSASDL